HLVERLEPLEPLPQPGYRAAHGFIERRRPACRFDAKLALRHALLLTGRTNLHARRNEPAKPAPDRRNSGTGPEGAHRTSSQYGSGGPRSPAERNIKEPLSRGRIGTEPLDSPEVQIQPASVDLRLGTRFILFRHAAKPYIDPAVDDAADYTEAVEIP